MDRSKLLVLALGLFLLCADAVGHFVPPPPPPKPDASRHSKPASPSVAGETPEVPEQKPGVEGTAVCNAVKKAPPRPVTGETLEVPEQKNAEKNAPPSSVTRETLEVQEQKPVVEGIGVGSNVTIGFCYSCCFRGTAVIMKKMLEARFPGIDVVFEDYPLPLRKQMLFICVPVVQAAVVFFTLAGNEIFPVLGLRALPRWYHPLHAAIFTHVVLLGNTVQSCLQCSGAFEIWCNNELVFSKLKEGRFSGEFELADLVAKRLADPRAADMLA